MSTNTQAQEYIKDTLSEDCHFILQAVKQLIEGTCCNQGETKICTWDLLPRINEALQEHIAFEERWFFPQLSAEQKLRHQQEHDKLRELLARTSWELECGYGDQFRTLTQELEKALHEHHMPGVVESVQDIILTKSCIKDGDLEKIRTRTVAPWRPEKAC